MNLKVGRVCPQRAGLRMQNGSGALGTDAPYHYWVQGHNGRVYSGNSLLEGEGRGEGEIGPPPRTLRRNWMLTNPRLPLPSPDLSARGRSSRPQSRKGLQPRLDFVALFARSVNPPFTLSLL